MIEMMPLEHNLDSESEWLLYSTLQLALLVISGWLAGQHRTEDVWKSA